MAAIKVDENGHEVVCMWPVEYERLRADLAKEREERKEAWREREAAFDQLDELRRNLEGADKAVYELRTEADQAITARDVAIARAEAAEAERNHLASIAGDQGGAALREHDALAAAQAREERLKGALRDAIAGCDAVREKTLTMIRKEVFAEDVLFWLTGWYENGMPNLARARAALADATEDASDCLDHPAACPSCNEPDCGHSNATEGDEDE